MDTIDEYKLMGLLLGVEEDDSFHPSFGKSSTLMIALTGARELSYRNIMTGEVDEEQFKKKLERIREGQTYDWDFYLGLIAYLIFLESLGHLFSKKDLNSGCENEKILHALRSFSQLEEDDRKSIKHLRNSLAHNFGLGNEKEIFILSQEQSEMIKHPEHKYARKNNSVKQQDHYTEINVIKLCDFVEQVYSEVVKNYREKKLKFRLNPHEVNARFIVS